MRRLSISLPLIAFLVFSTISTYADESDWTKTDTEKNDGVITTSIVPAGAMGWDTNSVWASNDSASLMMHLTAWANGDPVNDDVTVTSTVSTPAYCRDKYDWTAGGTPENHSFEISWLETFSWDILGHADNFGGGPGTAEAKAEMYVTYSGGPGDPMDCHEIDFDSWSKKVEDTTWWPKTLKIKWKPLGWPSVEWDLSADGTNNSFEDEPDSSEDECANNKPRSENIDSGTSNNVWAKATVGGNCLAKTLNNAFWVDADVDVYIHNFELEY